MASSRAAPTLENIPREIRNNIFELLLLEKNEMYPYGYASGCSCVTCGVVPPAVAILRVNKQFNAEGTKTLYSTATFWFSCEKKFAMFFSRKESGCVHRPPKVEDLYPSRHMIKKLIMFMTPTFTASSERLSEIMDMWVDPDFSERCAGWRKRAVHESGCLDNMLVWKHNTSVIRNLQGLNHVLLDIKSLFCPHGCCRMIQRLVRHLRKLEFKKGLYFGIQGQICNGENAQIAAAIEEGNEALAFYDARDNFEMSDNDSIDSDEDDDEDEDEDEDADEDEFDSDEDDDEDDDGYFDDDDDTDTDADADTDADEDEDE